LAYISKSIDKPSFLAYQFRNLGLYFEIKSCAKWALYACYVTYDFFFFLTIEVIDSLRQQKCADTNKKGKTSQNIPQSSYRDRA